MADKLTMVRAFVDWNEFKGANPTQMPVFGKLYVDIDGQPHPKSPFMNVSSAMAAWVPRPNPDPANENDSLNFVIDDIPESSDIDFRVELVPDPRIYPLGDPFGALSKDNVEFECRKTLRVAYVRVNNPFNANGPAFVSTNSIETAERMIRSAYPIPDIEYFDAGTMHALFNLDSTFGPPSFLARLWLRRFFMFRPDQQNDILFAWFPGGSFSSIGLGGQAFGPVGLGAPSSLAHAQYLMAHEVGHNFGSCHVAGTGGFDLCCLIPNVQFQPSLTLQGLGVDVWDNLAVFPLNSSVPRPDRPRIKAPTDFCSASSTTPVGCTQNGCNCLFSLDANDGGFCSLMMGACGCFAEFQWVDAGFYQHLLDSPIQHVLVRHEQGATHAADGYARATGRLGVCVATSGPGATNLVTGLCTASMDSVPLLCITGQVATGLIGTDTVIRRLLTMRKAGLLPRLRH